MWNWAHRPEFNLLMARVIQKDYGQLPQIVL